MSRHERVHANVFPFVCEKCGSGFYDIAGLSQHQKRCTGKCAENKEFREKLRNRYVERRKQKVQGGAHQPEVD